MLGALKLEPAFGSTVMPKLTIGMPVYNGAATIATALESLLAQTMPDFTLIISDNCSTDDTQRICESFAARDPRVRYVRQPINLGPAMNFRFVLFEAQTPFFMWAAADDLWARTFAERNLAALEADPTLVMSQSRVLFQVAGAPSHMSTGTYPLLSNPRENAARYFQNPADNSRYYGIFRTDALKQSFPTRPFYALDWAVSAATLRFGKHNELKDVLMARDSSDAAAYERAVAKDHRFILWRIFPLLFMSMWVLRRKLVPHSPALYYHLAKANLYMHFRFGLYRIDAIAQRYLASNSLRQALGLKRLDAPQSRLGLGPGLKNRLKQQSSGMARAVWRRLPISLETRNRIKQSVFRRFNRHVSGFDAYKSWAEPGVSAVVKAPDILASGAFKAPTPLTQPAQVSVVIVANSGLEDALRAIAIASCVDTAHGIEVVLSAPGDGETGAFALAGINGLLRATPDGPPTPGALINAGIARATAPAIFIVPAHAWYDDNLFPALKAALQTAPLVAPQVQSPDGRLLAAGGVIDGLGGVSHYGNQADAVLPAVSYVRDCDFAPYALALRRDVLATVSFSPSYQTFDATIADFCLAALPTHGRPRYFPSVRLGHPDAPAPNEETQRADRDTLVARNSARLAHYALIDAGNHQSQDRARTLRMLYVDADTPTPDQNAGSIEAINLMRMFGDFGFRVTFVPESNFVHRGHYTQALQDSGIECIHHPFASTIKDVLAGQAFDVVVLCRAYIAERYIDLVRQMAPTAKIIFNTVDLHFLREEREAALRNDAAAAARAAKSRETELQSISKSDITIVLSSYEKEMLENAAPNALVRVVPLVRNIPGKLDAPGFEKREHVLFVGTYQHPPNEDAAIFFAREVWPLVSPRLPGVKFLVAGSAVTPNVAALAGGGVKVMGFVDDLDTLLNQTRISVAPIRFGAGLKGKVATTLQAGVPTVATTIAAEGMALTDNREILIADTPEALADAVVQLYTDETLWRRLAQQGFEFVRREFSLETNILRVASLLEDIGVSTMSTQSALLNADIADGDEVFRPSVFWTDLAKQHEEYLDEYKLSHFKRTINNTYMQWLPGSFDDPRMRLPMMAFSEAPSLVPIEIAASAPPTDELAKSVIGYGGFSPFEHPDYSRFYAFYTGLLWHLMSLHASDDLYRRLEEPAIGDPIALSYRGQKISQDLAQSLLEYSRIKELTSALNLGERPTYLELGAGYGRLAYVILQSRPCRYIVVDIAPTLLISRWYLSRALPHLKIFGYRRFESFDDVREDMAAADVVFLSPNQLSLLPEKHADVSISISSLHEMTQDQIERYKALLQDKTASAIYLKQWTKWHNPIDDITVRSSDFLLSAPWSISLNATDLSNDEFTEMGWLRTG